MPRTRKNSAIQLLKGMLTAILFTLAAMLLTAAAVAWLGIPDKSIRPINQLIKIAAIILGTMTAVKRGGEAGLLSGTLIGLGYMVLGYAMYVALGGGSFDFSGILGEILIGTAAGAITGTIRANMSPKRRKS